MRIPGGSWFPRPLAGHEEKWPTGHHWPEPGCASSGRRQGKVKGQIAGVPDGERPSSLWGRWRRAAAAAAGDGGGASGRHRRRATCGKDRMPGPGRPMLAKMLIYRVIIRTPQDEIIMF
jgi:hypothetical protein